MERDRRRGLGGVSKADALRHRILFAASTTPSTTCSPRPCPIPSSRLVRSMRQAANIWCAANLNGLHFAGVEAKLTWIPAKSQSVRIAWTGLHGAQNALDGLQSEYVFNYPVENIQATWTAAAWPRDRAHQRGAACPALPADGLPGVECHPHPRHQQAAALYQLTNLSNTGYQEIGGVQMPPRAIMGGFVLQLGR